MPRLPYLCSKGFADVLCCVRIRNLVDFYRQAHRPTRMQLCECRSLLMCFHHKRTFVWWANATPSLWSISQGCLKSQLLQLLHPVLLCVASDASTRGGSASSWRLARRKLFCSVAGSRTKFAVIAVLVITLLPVLCPYLALQISLYFSPYF